MELENILGRFLHLHLLHGCEGRVVIGHGAVGRGLAQGGKRRDLHHPGRSIPGIVGQDHFTEFQHHTMLAKA